jgi:hypothetical protein
MSGTMIGMPGVQFGMGVVAACVMAVIVPPAVTAQKADAPKQVDQHKRTDEPKKSADVAEPPKKLSDADVARQGFSIVLLLGDMQGADTPDTVPPAARRALGDVKDFLPYKAYKLLDTQWVLCCSGGGSAITRLRGLENEDYELEIRSFPEPQSRLSIRFFLREPADALSQLSLAKSDGDRQRDTELFQLERERLDLQSQVQTLRSKVDVGTADVGELKRLEIQLRAVTNRIDSLKQQSTSSKFGSRAVIDTSFRMTIGETVVVGTSRLKGGSKALIALLTAVARPKDK